MPSNRKTTPKKFDGFSDFEREAIKNRAKELLAESKLGKKKAEGERIALAAMAKMAEPDRTIAKRIHAIIKRVAPSLWPKTWYGMPAYAKEDEVVCFFQDAKKFKARYATLGFSDAAKLDEGSMWPTSFGLKKLTATEEAKIAALVKQAVS